MQCSKIALYQLKAGLPENRSDLSVGANLTSTQELVRKLSSLKNGNLPIEEEWKVQFQ